MEEPSDSTSSDRALPLERIGRLSPVQQQALASHWITTVDSLVAASGTEDGQAGLCRVLNIGPDTFDALLKDARELLGEERFRNLTQAIPGGPMGALCDDEDVPRIDTDTKDDMGGQAG